MLKSMDFSETGLRAVGIIPARYASTRFPGKPLVEINGISMIQRVYRQAELCPLLHAVIVATDDERILSHVKNTGGKALMTGTHHASGTDRISEAIHLLEKEGNHFDIVVNIQGDEPFIRPEQIEKVIRLFSDARVQIGTLIRKIENTGELFNPNVVKVITDVKGRAMIFSRSPIPHIRGQQTEHWLNSYEFFKHIGIYAYRTEVLKEIARLNQAPPEVAESLEQLRWLWHGYRIYTGITDFETIGIDTPDDLSKLTNNS